MGEGGGVSPPSSKRGVERGLLVAILSMDAYRRLAMFSGIAVVIVGGVFALKAPFIFTEFLLIDGIILHYIDGILMEIPILPVAMIILGALTFILSLRGSRFLILPTSVCLGVVITSLTFMYRNDLPPARVDFGYEKPHTADFGYPMPWLIWHLYMVGPRIVGIVGVLAPTFLLDLAFWSLIACVVIIIFRLASKLRERRKPELTASEAF